LTSYETGIPNHVRWSKAKGEWMSEPEIMDERYLVARVRSKGLVVLTGCSHAGVINVCKDVQNVFAAGSEDDNGRNKIFFVVGGFHLAGNTVELRIKGITCIHILQGWVGSLLCKEICVVHPFLHHKFLFPLETVKDMVTVDPAYMAPGHCSGWRAKSALEYGFPGRVASLGVGSEFFITPQP